MNRTIYFDYIEERLAVLAYRINVRGRLNILDLHLHSEPFYLHFLKIIFGWDFVSANAIKQNVEAIDLIDHKNKLICQVSATNTKAKVETALAKNLINNYSNYTFKFISISKDAIDLRKQSFNNPHGINFDPSKDIIDNKSILDRILIQSIGDQITTSEFIKKELGEPINISKLDTNLAILINTLSKDNTPIPANPVFDGFEIQKKIDFNNLQNTNQMIYDFAIYGSKVDRQYKELDELGHNKSFSVLQGINKSFLEEKTKYPLSSSDDIFLKVILNVVDKVSNSANFARIPLDELELSVGILVVNAFIRCKIFDNPLEYKYAIA